MKRYAISRRRLMLGGVMLAAVVLEVVLGVTAAQAWTVTQPWQGILQVERDATETGPLSFTVYTKSGGIPDVNYANGSYDETSAGAFFNGAGVTSRAVSVDASAQGFQYATTMNALVADSAGKKQVCAFTQSIPVYFSAAQPMYDSVRYSAEQVTAAVSVVGTVPVSQVASVSVDGTLPVDWVTPVGMDAVAVRSSVWVVLAVGAAAATMSLGRRYYHA